MRKKAFTLCVIFYSATTLSFDPARLLAKEWQIARVDEAAGDTDIVIDIATGLSSKLKLLPQKQYLILLKGAKSVLAENERAILIGKYYDYKTGKSAKSFVLNSLKGSGEDPVFTLYTEIESFGYYSIRFVKIVEREGYEEEFRRLIKIVNDEDRDASTVFTTCFAGVRLYLEGVKPPDIVQFDYGWSMLFHYNEKIVKGPKHFFFLNAYPGAWVMSYKRAARDVFLSKISFSFGFGLSESEDKSRGWFMGITLPIVYDFSTVLGFSWISDAENSPRISFGVKIGPELFVKAYEAMILTKKPDF